MIKVINAKDEYSLVKKMNEECIKLNVYATNPYQKLDATWACFIYYRVKAKGGLATPKQIQFLKKLKIEVPKELTKLEASKLIEEKTKKLKEKEK